MLKSNGIDVYVCLRTVFTLDWGTADESYVVGGKGSVLLGSGRMSGPVKGASYFIGLKSKRAECIGQRVDFWDAKGLDSSAEHHQRLTMARSIPTIYANFTILSRPRTTITSGASQNTPTQLPILIFNSCPSFSLRKTQPAVLTLCAALTMPLAQANLLRSTPRAPSACFPMSSSTQLPTSSPSFSTWSYTCVFWFLFSPVGPRATNKLAVVESAEPSHVTLSVLRIDLVSSFSESSTINFR